MDCYVYFVYLPFVIFGLSVVVDSAEESDISEETWAPSLAGFTVVVVKGITFSSKDILIDVEVMMIGCSGSLDTALPSFDSVDTRSWLLFALGLLFDLCSVCLSFGKGFSFVECSIFLSFEFSASISLLFLKLSLIAAFKRFSLPWNIKDWWK